MRVGELTLTASICYEIALPHLIRDSVRSLRAEGSEPDALVVVSNNGWFWGSAEQDLILMGSVFRAVEARKPVLIAANTGISAWIDGDGRIREQAPRNQEAVIRAEVVPDGRTSLYVLIGDWPAGICLLMTIAAALHGMVTAWNVKARDAKK
jgi:apolipoprotein N-acyltransferase